MAQLLEISEAPSEPSAAAPHLHLHIPVPRMLTATEELEMARKAFARDQGSAVLRFRLASMLARLDHFNEAAALLEDFPAGDAELAHERFALLFSACIGMQTPEATLKARTAAERAAETARTPEQFAAALANLAKTYTRLGDTVTAERYLLQSLETNPHDKDAYKRLASLYLGTDLEKAMRLAETMIAKGVLHARVLGSVPLVLARMGRFEEAHKAEALDRFLLSTDPQPPVGWSSLDEFNRALTSEIMAHPSMRYGRYGTASARTWRVDEPSLLRLRVFPQLQQLIRQQVLAWAGTLSGSSHPLARACPSQALLRNWCVVTEGEGHETWHVHQNGWMSGVYYIHVQDHIAHGIGREGCLAFGISEEVAGDEAAAGYGERVVRPHTGLMMMFPSHSFHKTYPHHGEGHRICFAFDIVPTSATN